MRAQSFAGDALQQKIDTAQAVRDAGFGMLRVDFKQRILVFERFVVAVMEVPAKIDGGEDQNQHRQDEVTAIGTMVSAKMVRVHCSIKIAPCSTVATLILRDWSVSLCAFRQGCH